MEKIKTKCCIAGGGPAGIMLGYMLARAGIDVVVLEKWPDFFRDFRGDTIHPSTMDNLYELGILEGFLKLRHQKTRQMVGYIGGQKVTIADFSYLTARCPYIAFLPQWDFLNYITGEAKKYPHFKILMETDARDLIEEKERVVGVTAIGPEGPVEIHADLVVGADGRHSTIREKSKLPLVATGVPIDVLWFRLSAHGKDHEQSMGFIDNGKMLVALDRHEYWQCGFIIAKGHLEQIKQKGIEQFRKDISELAPFLSSSVHEIQNWDQVKFLSVTIDHLQTWYRPGLVCIGDAAHAMSPLGGVGINLAIQDAIATANVLVPAFKKGIPTESDFEKIQKRREFPTRMTQRIQVFMQDRFITPYLKTHRKLKLPWQIKLFQFIPLLRWIPAHFVGIGFRREHVSREILKHN